MEKTRVMVVDDSAVIRQVMTDIIKSDSSLELFAAVADPVFAMTRLEKGWPDVIILDVEMPRMDGISFLRKIMSEHPTPVVMCSTLTEKGAETTMQALSSGAVDIITKPKSSAKGYLMEESTMVLDAIKSAAKANMKRVARPRTTTPAVLREVAPKLTADAVLTAVHGTALKETTERIVAIGTSTGGTQALEQILTRLPRVSPGIVVVQHMPEKFTSAFANRLNSLCEVEVKEAANMDRVLPGRVLIAPGGKHMMLKRSGALYHVEVVDGPLVSRHRPSVDVLFRSMAKYAGSNALGVIMTGMGDDGAVGLKEMHEAGAETIAQDEATCVVFGMPKEAIKRGGVDHIMPLDDIPQAMLDYAGRRKISNAN